jgi:hypothetical protein
MKAYTGRTGIAVLILNLCNGWRWVVIGSRLLYSQHITPLVIEYKAWWAPQLLPGMEPRIVRSVA